jgi:DNA polymerase-3 subunit gamma/tau
MTQALYRRWRSQTFEDVVGQEHVSMTLHNALRDGHMSHAYLFAGPRGTGKTSTARILAKAINCLAENPAERPCNRCRICAAITDGSLLDLIEIDAASNRGIDEIRDLREKIGFRPGEARYKVYIIDEVHMLTKEAFNALLKTLEEPPPHAVFVLATTEPDRVPETVRSRCQRFDFRRIPTDRIVEHLQKILEREGGQASPEALAAIARRATGSMRDAISLLDQLLSYGDDVISVERVAGVLGLVDGQMIGQLVQDMADGNAGNGLALINRMVAEGVDLGQLVDQILVYLRAVLFVQVTRAPDALDLSQEVAEAVVRQAGASKPAFMLSAIREFLDARAALREQVPGVPQLPIELAFLRAGLAVAVSGEAADAPVVQVSGVPAHLGLPAPVVSHGSASENRPRVEPPAVAAPARRAQAEPAGPTGSAGEPAQGGDLQNAAQQNWDRFLVLAGKRCGVKVQAALRSVQAIEVNGSALILEFKHDFARTLIEASETRQQIEAAWEEILGRRVQVRCTIVGQARPAAPAAAGPETDDEDFLRGAQDLGAEVRRLD